MGRVRQSSDSPERFLGLLEAYERRIAALERKIHDLSFPEVPYFTTVAAAGRALDLQRPGERFRLSADWGNASSGSLDCIVTDIGSAIRVYCTAAGPVYRASSATTTRTSTSASAFTMSGATISLPPGIAKGYGYLWSGIRRLRAWNGGSGGRCNADLGFQLANLGTYYATAYFDGNNAVYSGCSLGGYYGGGAFGWNASDGDIEWAGRYTFETGANDETRWYYPQLMYYPYAFDPS